MSVAHHTLARIDHPGDRVESGSRTRGSAFPITSPLEAAHSSLAHYKPCDLTISCPNRSVSLHRSQTPTTPNTPTMTSLSEASQITNISCTEHPCTHPSGPSSGPLHPLPDSLDALDRSALEHVARMLYADSINSRSAAAQAHVNVQRTRAEIDSVGRRTDLAIASLRLRAEEEEEELRKQKAEVEVLRSRLAQVSDVLSAILPADRSHDTRMTATL
ncbi:hypothetical protein BCR44DRAFT_37729, partial [Catenaria anguillulae PL171]